MLEVTLCNGDYIKDGVPQMNKCECGCTPSIRTETDEVRDITVFKVECECGRHVESTVNFDNAIFHWNSGHVGRYEF